MATAIALPAIQGPEIEQLREILQRRRTLERTEHAAREDHTHQQETITALAARLVDASDTSVERELLDARERLRDLAAESKRAAAELSEYASNNPTPEELERREAILEHRTQLAEQKKVRDAFAQNVQRRISLLETLKTLEAQAWELFTGAEQRWRNHVSGPSGESPLRPVAGMSPTLLDFLDRAFWSFNGKPGFPGGRLNDLKQLVKKWDPNLIPDAQQST